MLGRRRTDNFDSYLVWLKVEYLDPTVDATLEKAKTVWIEIVRDELASYLKGRELIDQQRDHDRDWRTVRIATGVALIVSVVSWAMMKMKGWL